MFLHTLPPKYSTRWTSNTICARCAFHNISQRFECVSVMTHRFHKIGAYLCKCYEENTISKNGIYWTQWIADNRLWPSNSFSSLDRLYILLPIYAGSRFLGPQLMNNMGFDMKKLIVGLFVLGGLVGFTHAAGNAENGKGLTAMCAGCHGADGNSAVASFPKLAGQGERYLYKQLQDVKADRRIIVAMTGMLAALNDQQLADIAAYYASPPFNVLHFVSHS